MSVQEIKKEFRAIIASNPKRDPYELHRIFMKALCEWEAEHGWEAENVCSLDEPSDRKHPSGSAGKKGTRYNRPFKPASPRPKV